MLKPPIEIEVLQRTPTGLKPVDKFVLRNKGAYAIGRADDNQIRLESRWISRYHAWLEVSDKGVRVADRGSTNGTFINEEQVTVATYWDGKAQLRVGDFELRLAGTERENRRGTDIAPPERAEPRRPPPPQPPQRQATPPPPPPPPPPPLTPAPIRGIDVSEDGHSQLVAFDEMEFPNNIFDASVVSTAAIKDSQYYAGEWEYLAVGGGLGSFVWIDHLRVYGVPEHAIRAIGIDPVCYGTYKRYCANSQIPDHERLRSNSISAPDNIWGFPGYASRETWNDLKRGHIGGFKHIFQVFGEPALAESYTPRAGDVFKSIDKEAARIGWDRMFMRARVISIRKTDDGRFAVAFRVPSDTATGSKRDNIVIGRIVHVSVGYPATRFIDELQQFRTKYREDAHLVVNAYEEHDDLYRQIESAKGPALVIIQGRGIVASRVLQRLYEARKRNNRINVLHLMRSRVGPNKVGRFNRARRAVYNDTEIQPFNWPKSCWGGELRKQIEQASERERADIMARLDGTTTADRSDWTEIIAGGKREKWYEVYFGKVKGMMPGGGERDKKVVVQLEAATDHKELRTVHADFVIDCTGLIADVQSSPFLKDMLETYDLPQNKRATGAYAGITVTNDFEIAGMRNTTGRVYAAGTITSGGPYAAVDSFLGLQYAAIRSVEHLCRNRAPGLRCLGPLRSFSQWCKWCAGAQP